MAGRWARSAPWFAFLAHPRDLEDVRRSPGGRFLRDHSRDDDDYRGKIRSMPPLVVTEFRFGFGGTWGELVSPMRLPEDMLASGALEAVAEAAEVAVRRGAKVIGLGALTSPATGSGLRLAPKLPAGVSLTTGNAYTAAVIRANVLEVVEILGLGRRARVGVVGCTGSVGHALTQLLAHEGFDLQLNGRTAERAERMFKALDGTMEFGSDTESLHECHVVVLLTSDPDALLRPEALQPGAVVIDCAQPANVQPEDRGLFAARGVATAEGGLVRIPGYTTGFDFRHSVKDAAFACLAETYLIAREGLRLHSVGRPDADVSLRMERIAQRRQVAPIPMRELLDAVGETLSVAATVN